MQLCSPHVAWCCSELLVIVIFKVFCIDKMSGSQDCGSVLNRKFISFFKHRPIFPKYLKSYK